MNNSYKSRRNEVCKYLTDSMQKDINKECNSSKVNAFWKGWWTEWPVGNSGLASGGGRGY